MSASIVIPLILCIYFSVSFFYRTAKQPPLVIGTADGHSFYYTFGQDLRKALASPTHPAVFARLTKGSQDNANLLEAKRINVALMQAGAVDLSERNISVVSALFPETIHVLALRAPEQAAPDGDAVSHRLAGGATVYIGELGSGMRQSGMDVLVQHSPANASPDAYPLVGVLELWEPLDQLNKLIVEQARQRKTWELAALIEQCFEQQVTEGFSETPVTIEGRVRYLVTSGFLQNHISPETNAELISLEPATLGSDSTPPCLPEIVILTTRSSNQDLKALLQRGDYELISIDAEGLADQHEFYRAKTIPVGRYGHDKNNRPIPPQPVKTVATTAVLAVRDDAPASFVKNLLRALQSTTLHSRQPVLMDADEVRTYLADMPFHTTARAFYDPYDPGRIAMWVEMMAGSKELLFATGAGLFFLWRVRRQRRKSRRDRAVAHQRNRLRYFLEATIAIEAAQMNVRDPARLRPFLDEITQLKLRALKELTHEDIQGDRTFSIFLTECAHLINKMQLKMITYAPELTHGKDDRTGEADLNRT
jgi:TRAP-type uncharacterized transport system substrate-binding protein